MIYETRFWRSLFFDEHAMIGVRTCATRLRAWVYFALAVLFQVLPVSKEDLLRLQYDVPKIAAMYFGLLVLGALLSWLLGAKMPFYKYLYTTSTIMTFGGVVIAAIAYTSLLIEYFFNTATVTNLVISLVPFYYIVLFAYSIEVSSHLVSQWRRVLVAILMICAMYGAYFFL